MIVPGCVGLWRVASLVLTFSHCLSLVHAEPFWIESISRKGAVAFGDDASYKVYRNVKDYGAKGRTLESDLARQTNTIQVITLRTIPLPYRALSLMATDADLAAIHPRPHQPWCISRPERI
jgi:hypothetical protein